MVRQLEGLNKDNKNKVRLGQVFMLHKAQIAFDRVKRENKWRSLERRDIKKLILDIIALNKDNKNKGRPFNLETTPNSELNQI